MCFLAAVGEEGFENGYKAFLTGFLSRSKTVFRLSLYNAFYGCKEKEGKKV